MLHFFFTSKSCSLAWSCRVHSQCVVGIQQVRHLCSKDPTANLWTHPVHEWIQAYNMLQSTGQWMVTDLKQPHRSHRDLLGDRRWIIVNLLDKWRASRRYRMCGSIRAVSRAIKPLDTQVKGWNQRHGGIGIRFQGFLVSRIKNHQIWKPIWMIHSTECSAWVDSY